MVSFSPGFSQGNNGRFPMSSSLELWRLMCATAWPPIGDLACDGGLARRPSSGGPAATAWVPTAWPPFRFGKRPVAPGGQAVAHGDYTATLAFLAWQEWPPPNKLFWKVPKSSPNERNRHASGKPFLARFINNRAAHSRSPGRKGEDDPRCIPAEHQLHRH